MQSEPTYRIKPLEWEEDNSRHFAQTIFCLLVISERRGKVVLSIGVNDEYFTSLDAAKTRAARWLADQLLNHLEVVTDGR